MSVDALDRTAVTETQALVARLSAERSAMLARLARGVAHELRNPLAVILARVQLLALGLRNGRPLEAGKLERMLETVEEQALRASRVIDRLAIFAGAREPETASVDLPEAIGAAVVVSRTVQPGDAVGVDVEVGDDALTADADREQLVTALTQLVVNALEATPAGGRVTILTRRAPGGLEVVVRDTGPGVAASDAGHIFDPFFTTKPAAAGLGLCVAQAIAERHGGSVRLAAPGRAGAEFVLGLPARS